MINFKPHDHTTFVYKRILKHSCLPEWLCHINTFMIYMTNKKLSIVYDTRQNNYGYTICKYTR